MNTFWRVLIALLAIGAVVSLVTLLGGERPIGSENLIGHALPDFAAPLASGKLEGDANIYTRPQARAADSTAACDVELPGAFVSCRDLGDPAVLMFWNSTRSECVAQLGTLERFSAVNRDVSTAAVAFDRAESEVREFLSGHKTRLPVPIDRDGAVAGLYAVAVCPTTFFVRGGEIVGVKLGRLSEEQLRQGLKSQGN
jgi:hypothetical protein